MRIGIDIRTFVEPFPSGVTEYTYQIIRHLLMRDKANTYLFFYNSLKKIDDRYKSLFNEKNAVLKEFHWPSKAFNSSLFFLKKPELDSLLGGVDLFFMPNLNFWHFSAKCRLVLTVHDLSFFQSSFYTRKAYYWHKFIGPEEALRRADKIIAVSSSTKSDLETRYQISPKKISVIPLGVDMDFSDEVDQIKCEELKNKFNLNKPFILYLATVEKRKNIEGLLQAWKIAGQTEYDLVIAGKVDKKTVKICRGTEKIIGYVSDQEKKALYKTAKAFIYPSYYEGFGLPVLEAMAAGTAVITSHGTSLPAISGGTAILIDPYNPQEIVAAIKQVMTNDIFREKIAKRAKEWVRQFTWENTAEKTLEILTSK
ncbi:MAG: glycosyltransferase family 1 protein [Patescibacteria group bacterium]|jgi:glycosyltransferase involved in cell wall biosynthesis